MPAFAYAGFLAYVGGVNACVITLAGVASVKHGITVYGRLSFTNDTLHIFICGVYFESKLLKRLHNESSKQLLGALWTVGHRSSVVESTDLMDACIRTAGYMST